MQKTFCVYKHTAPNGKVYIGITSRTAEKRWNNGHNYKQNKHFYNAIQKYGWNNFEHEIIFNNLSKEDACEKEKNLIAKYNSNNRKFGYNNSIGGENPSQGAHWKLSKEVIEKRASKMRGRKLTEEHRKKLSDSHKGHSSCLKGKTLSEETKNKISQSLKEWNRNNVSPNKGRKYKKSEYAIMRTSEGHYKKIICIETEEIFDSLQMASKLKNIDGSSLSKVCRGKRQTAGGFHWRYFNEV